MNEVDDGRWTDALWVGYSVFPITIIIARRLVG